MRVSAIELTRKGNNAELLIAHTENSESTLNVVLDSSIDESIVPAHGKVLNLISVKTPLIILLWLSKVFGKNN